MPDSTRGRTLLAFLTLVTLVVLTLDFRQGNDGPLAGLQRGALFVFGPVQEGFATVVRPVGGFLSAIGDIGSLRAENAQLEQELARLRESTVEMEDLRAENDELRGLLSMRDRLQFDTVAATVIGQPPGQVAYSVLIDAGSDQGLQAGMAVINDRGLVGKLTQVVSRHARVELLSSPDARYAVRTAPSGQTGLMQGLGARPFRLEIRDPSAQVQSGDQVLTRTFEGSTIPDGIAIGVIEEDADQASPRFRAVRPYVDFAGLTTVQIVTNAVVQPSELPADDLVTPPARQRPQVDPDEPSEPNPSLEPEDQPEMESSEQPARGAA